MADHPSGNPDLIRQHKEKQREGDDELGEKRGFSEDEVKNRGAKPIGKGMPDKQEGIGTVQNQNR